MTAWSPSAEIMVPVDAAEVVNAGSRFGFAVAMNETYAVVGAPDARIMDPDIESLVNGAGAAYVFKRSGNTWTFQQRLIAPTIALAQTGTAVAIDATSGDIVVGAWGYNGHGLFSGAAFFYKKGAGDSWGIAETTASLGARTRMPTQSLIPGDLTMIDEFGFSVAIQGDTIAVGCPLSGDTNAGAVYTFDRVGDTWTQGEKLVDAAGGANDQLGTKVALDGNLLVCGVQNDDVIGKVNAGSAIVFKRAGAGASWTYVTKLLRPVPVAGGQFGASVAVRDGAGGAPNYIAIGAPTTASGATTQIAGNGLLYVYSSADADSWVEDQALLPRADNINNNFGYSVAMTQTDPPMIAVGAPGYDTIVPSVKDPLVPVQVINAGSAFSFEFEGGDWVLRGTGALSGDMWTPDVQTANTSIGRSVAISPSSGGFAVVGAETPSGSDGTVFGFEYTTAELGTGDGNVSGPSGGVLGGGGGGGGGGGIGGGGTGGGITGGGAPGTGSDIGGGFTIPLTPIVESWGLIKGSAVALRGQGVSALQTDGVHAGNVPRFHYVGELPEGATFVGLGDMNGDKSGDIVYVTAANALKFWKRDGFQILADVLIDTLPPGFNVVAVADIDGDGKTDIVLQDVNDSRSITVWYMSGGSISSSADYVLPPGDWTIYVGPFGSSASSNILIRDIAERDLRLLVDDGTTVTFQKLRDGGGRLVGFGDMDSDGQPDLWWQAGEVSIDFYQQEQDGSYSVRERMRTSIEGASVLDVRDWNGDGVLDVWMRRGARNYVLYLKWDGHAHIDRGRDIGTAPGRVTGFADR